MVILNRFMFGQIAQSQDQHQSQQSRQYHLTREVLQPKFNVGSYTGHWYQIARIPKFYEADCRKASADYQIITKKEISVVNNCYDANYRLIRQVKGTAQILYPQYPAALYVQFSNQAQPSNFNLGTPGTQRISNRQSPNYLVHKTDYSTYALVGSSDRQSLWILSRSETMEPKLYQKLVQLAQEIGYNVSKLVINC